MASNQASTVHATGNTPTTEQSSDESTFGPNSTLFTRQFIDDSTWPADLTLDLYEENWDEWSYQVFVLAGQQRFSGYLDGTLDQPPADTHPRAHNIWAKNDSSLKWFLYKRIARNEYRAVAHLPTSYTVFEELRETHEEQGAHAQVVLLLRALNIRSQPHTPLLKTAEEVDKLYDRIARMGQINFDDVHMLLFLHCLSEDHVALQSHLMGQIYDTSFTWKSILRRFSQEDDLSRRRTELDLETSGDLAAQNRGRPRPLCAHCKKLGHKTDFCVAPGGKMAGKSIKEAKAARRRSKQSRSETATKAPSTSANVARSDNTATSLPTVTKAAKPDSIVLGGITYYPVTGTPATTAFTPSTRIDPVVSDSEDSTGYSYHSYLAINGPVKASVDWDRPRT